MNKSKMMRRASVGVAAAGAACALSLATAPAASAAPAIQPVEAAGSVASICFNIPIGPASVSICL